MKEFEVIPYTMEDGTIPFYEFMGKQSKKTQKTPRREIEKAKKYRKDYLTREVS